MKHNGSGNSSAEPRRALQLDNASRSRLQDYTEKFVLASELHRPYLRLTLVEAPVSPSTRTSPSESVSVATAMTESPLLSSTELMVK